MVDFVVVNTSEISLIGADQIQIFRLSEGASIEGLDSLGEKGGNTYYATDTDTVYGMMEAGDVVLDTDAYAVGIMFSSPEIVPLIEDTFNHFGGAMGPNGELIQVFQLDGRVSDVPSFHGVSISDIAEKFSDGAPFAQTMLSPEVAHVQPASFAPD